MALPVWLLALIIGALCDTIRFPSLFATLSVFDILGAILLWVLLKNNEAIEVSEQSEGP
ncbi:MAG: Hexuronate transporter [Candidatus Celerinatantimonas neptuna]|nr:MAG: Hexuronate transporter [Candidatus Celerinatantimonas neptuna]